MKRCDLDMPLLVRAVPFVLWAFFTLGFPLMVLRGALPAVLLVVMLPIAAWNWWVLGTLVYRVLVHDDGTVEWVALRRRVRTLPESIRTIRPERSGTIGFFVVEHAAGKVRFFNQITGFHEVLLHVKTRNPAVVIKGC